MMALAERNPFLTTLGNRVREERARQCLSRKKFATISGVSERHLASLEAGVGNVSILVLKQVASVLDYPLGRLVSNRPDGSSEHGKLLELLEGRSESDLRRGRLALASLYEVNAEETTCGQRVALIGLRGAGKSTLGTRLAEYLAIPFIELSRDVERLAGCTIGEIHDMYGAEAYQRYERRAVEQALSSHSEAVIATPGGIVSERSTFEALLNSCKTVWIEASAEEHMSRVIAQGDMRPMAKSRQAMNDLRRILTSRATSYARADARFDTTGKSEDVSFWGLVSVVGRLLEH